MLSLLSSNPLLFFLYILALLIAVAVHEFSHAKMADYLGDPTPRLQGRVSLNPLVHIDPIGIVFLLFFGFGWGKPVMFDPFNLRNPRRDAALISFAGPFSNFVLAIFLSLILRMFISFPFSVFLVPIIYLNVILGVFNFLPVHPLDGFKMVGGLLSAERAHEWYQLERFGLIFLLLLILPIGGSSMLTSILFPIVKTILALLVPAGIGGTIL
ncbi:site-2 protease family protein [Candidatus Roizmanbacteria bacterium]|nr:site-2 protease family protein [Candidatus Roizmanbacteria bacterium]